jgi:hypothetical protein
VSQALPGREPTSAELLADGRKEQRRIGLRLLRRLVAYHAVLMAFLILAAAVFPDSMHDLPIGGVKELVAAGDIASGKSGLPAGNTGAAPVAETLSTGNALNSARELAIVLIGTWLLMLPISWVHKGIHRASEHDHSLDETVLILPGIVAGIVLVVQHSLALAFSLAGIVAGVEFRRALQDTFDALFILVAIGTGIAAGVRALEIAAVLTIFFTYSTLYVHYFGDGLESDFLARKKAEKKQRKHHADDASAKDDDAD